MIGPPVRRNTRGAGLVEVLVALALLAGALLVVVALYASAVRATRGERSARRAAVIADDLLEELAATPAAALDAARGPRPPLAVDGVDFAREVEVERLAGSLRRVRVVVRHPGGAAVLETLRTEHE